jgi:hypothetical protein
MLGLLAGLLLAGPGPASRSAGDGGTCSEIGAEVRRRGEADPGLWVSHAECLQKAGAKGSAKQAANQAVRAGSRGTRLDAYAVLGRLGIDLWKGKTPGPSDCVSVPSSDDSCLQPIWACGYLVSATETGTSSQGSGVALCASHERAAGGDWAGKHRPLEPAVPACAIMEFAAEADSHCSPSEVYGHDLPDGGKCVEAADGIACETAVARCKEDPRNKRLHRCVLVYADACRLRVGAICDGHPAEFPP